MQSSVQSVTCVIHKLVVRKFLHDMNDKKRVTFYNGLKKESGALLLGFARTVLNEFCLIHYYKFPFREVCLSSLQN